MIGNSNHRHHQGGDNNTMWSIEKQIDIDHHPDTVYEYLRHFDTVQEWDTTVLCARQTTSGPPLVGSRFKVTLLIGWNRVPMDYQILEVVPSQKLVLKGAGPEFEAIDRIQLEPFNGGTRLTYQVEVTFRRPPARLTNAVAAFLFNRHAGRTLIRLRALLSGFGPPRLTPLTRMVDKAILPGLIGFTRAGYIAAKNRRPVASTLYADKIMVITGATSGIGKAAAKALFAKGSHLIVVGRSAEKLDGLRRELQASSGTGRIETEIADLGLLEQVRALADRLNSRHGRIDVLINNAGALFNAYGKTAEGIEMTLATDLVSPYLLTRLLLPALHAAPAARIINVASGGMYTQGIDPNALESDPETYDGPAAYARAKRGLVVLTRELARELAPYGISVHAMHPGWVDTPGLEKALPAFHRQLSSWLRTPAQGADTIVWLAASPDAAEASGRFWLDRKIRAVQVFPHTRTSAKDRRALIRALDAVAGLPPAGGCLPG